ncbi:MAG: GNAT family N-acetyltransferase [Butyrivibrio sp.]|nr:GNAT family N-acetyltransferase [Butyrivibrio sp.]
MLKQVIFVIDPKFIYEGKLRSSIDEAISYIRENGYSASLFESPEKDLVFPDGTNLRESLVVTDDIAVTKKALDMGAYTVGMLHDGNKGATFEGTKYIFSDIGKVDIDSYVKVYQRYAGEPWEMMRTERLIIRETTVDDVDEFYEIYKDPEITRYLEGLFDDPADEKRYQKDYIEKVYGLMGFGVWTLVRRSDGRIIGRAGFSVRNGFDEVELGFIIGTEFQRQGYCLEACRAILEYGRKVLEFDKVQTLVKEGNTVSLHICEKLGFKRIEEVEVEENIYGDTYREGRQAGRASQTYGRYVRMLMTLGTVAN